MELTGERGTNVNTNTFNLEFTADHSEILRYLGYRGGSVQDAARISRMVSDLYQEVKRFSVPRGIYGTFWLEKWSDGALFLPETSLCFHSQDLEALLKDSEKVTILASTLGRSVDQLISYLLASGEYVKAAIADAIGSAAAESAIEQVNAIVREEAKREGKALTDRFSPGYGDVPLTLQKDILDLIGAKKMDIEVTEAFILKPRKSVTAIVGWTSPSSRRSESRVPDCQSCRLVDCRFRR